MEGLESNLIVSIGGYDVSRDIKFPENFILVSEINREDLSILSPLTTLEYFSDSNVDILQKVGLPQKYKIKSTDHVDGYEYDQNKADAYNKSMFLVDYIIKNNRITKENSSEVWIKAAEKVFSENDFFVK